MSPSDQIRREVARIAGVNSAIQNSDGTRGNDQLRHGARELEAIADALDAVKPIEASATTEIRSGFYLAATDLDAIRERLDYLAGLGYKGTVDEIRKILALS